jgi:hypothetical protein
VLTLHLFTQACVVESTPDVNTILSRELLPHLVRAPLLSPV